MSARAEVRLSARLQRKDPRLPVFVVVPGRALRRWDLTGTTVVEGTANGVPIGRRTIKSWGRGRDDWFVEFTAAFCEQAGLDVGDRVELVLAIADASVPEELEVLLAKSKRLSAAWNAWSESERRAAGEHVRAGKARATRERRAAKIVERLRG